MQLKWGVVVPPKTEHLIPPLPGCNTQIKRRAFVSYLPNVYGREDDLGYMLWHQNRREQLVIGRVLHEMGYEVKVGLWSDPACVDNRSYDLIFGMGPTFEEVCRRNPSALKIYYATGAHPDFHKVAVETRAKDFNRRHNTNIVPERSVGTESSSVVEFSEAVFQIGTSFTLETYPEQFREKVQLINQSSNFIGECDLSKKKACVSQKNFLWIGSGGSILKGLDLLIDYFSRHPEFNLYVVGNVDRELKNIYKNTLKGSKNIFLFGFLNTQTEKFRKICYRCGFLVFPSCTEGCPGSVITAMRMGCVPIVSRPASFEEINDYGFLLDELTYEKIEQGVNWATSLSIEKFQYLISKNIVYSQTRWNLERFEKEIFSAFSSTIQKFHSTTNE